jgi:hypothetical protein
VAGVTSPHVVAHTLTMGRMIYWVTALPRLVIWVDRQAPDMLALLHPRRPVGRRAESSRKKIASS